MAKYYRRLILPWFVACIVHVALAGDLGLLTPVTIFIRPPFHLWFVPVMMAFIITATISHRAPADMMAIALPASIVSMYAFGVGHTAEQLGPWVPDRRFFIYPIFFFYGLWMAHRVIDPWKQALAGILAVIAFLWWCRLYTAPALASEVAAELMLGLALIHLLPRVRTLTIDLAPVAWIGRESLFFYLWHPLAFGLCAYGGAHGWSMLALSMAMLAAAAAVLGRAPRIAPLFGLTPLKRPRKGAPPPAPLAI